AHKKLERLYKVDALTIKRHAIGLRNSYTAIEYNNNAVMEARDQNLSLAIDQMKRALAIFLSLDNAAHPSATRYRQALASMLAKAGQTSTAQRLTDGDFTDLTPIVEDIEDEHRRWVAQDPDNRAFGPPSPITGATK
ncbi:MAG: tetratricopeptide repeat protein, partial [Pseudomonadota bacterium]